MSSYEYSKYVTDSKNIKSVLKEYGVAIIPEVLDEKECDKMVDGIWNYFEHISSEWEVSLKRDDKNTWREIYKILPLHSMLFQHFGAGHSQVVWDLRQNPKILDLFSKIWDCKVEDLLVSFDGLSFNMPPEITNRGWNRNNTWYHTDQSFTRNKLECIQSWVTGLDVEDGDATLAFMEGSNRLHGEFAKKFGVTDKKDWYKLSRDEEQFFLNRGCMYKKIKCPKGSIVFWDSRTIHCGAEALKGRKNPNLRAIIYLCYTPRKICDKKILKKRIKAFEELRMTTHCPHNIRLFPKTPRTYGNELPKIKNICPPKISDIGKTLVGF